MKIFVPVLFVLIIVAFVGRSYSVWEREKDIRLECEELGGVLLEPRGKRLCFDREALIKKM